MEITYSIPTPFKMIINVDNKKMVLTGEGTTTPAFYADIKSMKNWEPPYENEKITELEKQEIIKVIEQMSQKQGEIPIYFE
ncbi:hypothetical protein ETU10_06930 [Apibacter muscae]|uniref:Imm74 family immunity protein n=1 Tax=Apibacter muscae TaxID=2509004 RepID=UPI0011AD6C70|nr:Imm74 family immunity protein [Apibacter muscae]TWP23457.1 hypothetical protein ETU10_06930 [Apibacter muscae]